MNIYIDESGTINNKSNQHKYFVIALIRVTNKVALKKAFKRFISSNLEELKSLDTDKTDELTGKILKPGNKMFNDGKFVELKGSQFSPSMKMKFVEFFSRLPYFEIFFIRVNNQRLSDTFCSNTARVFNYTIRLALEYYILNGFLPNENCCLQLDERNEKTESRYFLAGYLNTELKANPRISCDFDVLYFDSADNQMIQIADVFANFFFSHLQKLQYLNEIELLKSRGILKHIFVFPK